MANLEHLEILKQGVKAWNEWRENNYLIRPDLSGAVISRAVLSHVFLREADLSRAVLREAIFSRAVLREADLSDADLSGAFLSGAVLREADLSRSFLSRADLREADLREADLCGAFLTNVRLDLTTFANNDLGEVKGLESIHHDGPSTIGVDTLNKSAGKIPESFLRGCGLSDWQIDSAKLYRPELSNEEITDTLYRIHDLRAHQAIQINPLFISYNHTDSPFVDEIEKFLNKKGVRFWRDIRHATSGRLERQIDRAIRLNPTVILILSEHSVESDWVQHEARLARKLEIETKRDVLCPVALDDSWKDCDWPERIREQIMEYNVLDFSGWEDKANFRRMFSRLLDGLDLFYK
jgi:uncharacterized protein YjbI with pentapeptide repeats